MSVQYCLQKMVIFRFSFHLGSTCCSFPFRVTLLRGHKLDFRVGRARGHAAVPHRVSEQEGKGLPEGFAEAGPHEAVDDGVDGRVGVGHAVGPRLDLVGGVVDLEVGVETLEEDEDLNGAPANGEERHDDHYHFGDLASDGEGSLGEEMHLETKQEQSSTGQHD